MQIRIWKVALTEFELNYAQPPSSELFAHLSVNLNVDGSAQSLGFDGSEGGNDFYVEAVDVTRIRLAEAVSVDSDGTCRCSLELPNRLAATALDCDNPCADDSTWTCGSTSNSLAVSLYQLEVVTITDLAPNTTYEVAVSFSTSRSFEMESTKQLIVTTTAATTPGRINQLNLVERSGYTLELQWTSPDDDGGLPVSNYLMYINGFLFDQTGSGSTTSASLIVPATLSEAYVSVCAVNSIGEGPHSRLLTIYRSDIVEPYALSQLEVFAVTGGTVAFLLDERAATVMKNSTASIIVEQRAWQDADFSTSVFTVSEDFIIVVYKLLHDNFYVFRAYTELPSSGARSPPTPFVVVKTSHPGDPSKTPTPTIASATGTAHSIAVKRGCSSNLLLTSLYCNAGGSITMLLEEPMDTGITCCDTESHRLRQLIAGTDWVIGVWSRWTPNCRV